jgi:Na+/proline symporter
MFLPAMAAQQFLPGIADTDVYPMLCITLLPAGMLGLVIAAMFAATMSMLSSDYNVCASVLTNDIYRRLIRPDASEKELVLVGRLMTMLVGICALGVALLMMGGTGEGLFRTMVTLFSIATAPVAIPMILGLLSKRVTNWGAIAGFLAGLGTGLLLYFFFYLGLPDDRNTSLLGMTFHPDVNELVIGALRLKMEVVLFAGNALVTLLVTLVVTAIKPMSADARERSDELHQRLATPIGQLPQDLPASASGGQLLSPFHVVGISIAWIGAMMLAVLPWVADRLATGLDLGLGVLLIVCGILMVLGAPAPNDEVRAEKSSGANKTQ